MLSRSTASRSSRSPLLLAFVTALTLLSNACNVNAALTVGGVGATRRLFTSSSAYCAVPQVLVVENVELTLYPDNSTIEFELAAASLNNDVNATISASVDAYSRSLFDFNLDLCTIANGALCPLPTYQFNGGGVFPIPESFADVVPSIAYTVPDLEGVATLQLTGQDGSVVACIQLTLSNGQTARQPAARWATVGLALLALLSSLLHSVIAQSIGAAQWRVIDVFQAIQHVATTGLLSMTFPTVFNSFASNFAWSIGLVNITSVQNSIDSTRASTGANTGGAIYGDVLLAQAARNAVVLQEEENSATATSTISNLFGSLARLFSTSEAATTTSGMQTAFVDQSASSRYSMGSLSSVSSHLSAVSSLFKRAAHYAPNTGADAQPLNSSIGAPLPILVDTDETSYGGFTLYCPTVGVAAPNAFLTVLVSIAILLAIVIGALLVTYLLAMVFRLLTRKRRREGTVSHWSRRVTRPSEFGYVAIATLGRFILVILPIMFIFSFYQWRHGDSWVPDLLAGIFLAFFLVIYLVLFLPMIRHARRGQLYPRHAEAPVLAKPYVKRWGALAHPYRPKYYWFSSVFILMSIIRACFIAFAQGQDFTQSVGLLVFEVVFFVVLCVLRVGRDKKSDFVLILSCFFRLATWAACVALTQRAGVTWIPRVVVGFVLIVITGLPIIWMFFLTVWDLFTPFLPSKRRPKHGSTVYVDGDEQEEEQHQKNGAPVMEQRESASPLRESTVGSGATSRHSSTVGESVPTTNKESSTTTQPSVGGGGTSIMPDNFVVNAARA